MHREIAISTTERKNLKRKRHEAFVNDSKQESEQRKRLRKGDAFFVDQASDAVKNKSQSQRELDKLWFETKQFGMNRQVSNNLQKSMPVPCLLRTMNDL